MKTKHKVIIVEESEVRDLDDFICPNCQEELVNKDYKINQFITWGLILGALGFWFGYFIGRFW